jgi:hypothetical protein
MNAGRTRPGGTNHDSGRRRTSVVTLALLALGLSAVSAQAAPGGLSRESGGLGVTSWTFGSRVLHEGMEGADVRVLNGIVSSKPYGGEVGTGKTFESPTATAVRQFQRRKAIAATGVVDTDTATALTRSMPLAGATWYGPGFYGNETACGRVLRTGTVGVAHRTLPCGTKVTFFYHGRYLVVPVIDRGPFAKGYDWDLTGAAAQKLGFTTSDRVRYAVAG